MADVEVEHSGGVLTVTLNRPEKKNAVTTKVWEDLRDLFSRTRASSDVRVVVVTGAGGAFCSGADLTDLEGMGAHPLPYMRIVSDTALSLHRLPQPTIAKVEGIAAGAGCNLALSCDLIVASDSARFTEIFSKRGLAPDFGGSWLLPRLIGLHRAKELVFFGDILSAADALDIGLINKVVPADELDGVVSEWAARLAAGPPLALSMAKSLLNNSFATSLEQALEIEAGLQSVNLRSEDGAEAMAAFVAKREPQFKGR